MIKLLIGGSPCTYWSIAQKNNRETAAEGMGWELFKNYLIAKEKFQPDFFLYENNKSAAAAIKEQIRLELKVGESDARYIEINSALVSAQNRQRFYVHNCGDVKQPKDRGILLRDMLESGIPCRNEKAYCLDANYFKGGNISSFTKQSGMRLRVAEPVRVGTIESGTKTQHDSKPFRVYSPDGKSVCLQGNAGGVGAQTGIYAAPVSIGYRNRREEDGKLYRRFETSGSPKANALTTVQTDSMVAEPIPFLSEREMDYMVGDTKGKWNNRWSYLQKPAESDKALCLTANMSKGVPYNVLAEPTEQSSDGKPVYEVRDGMITIKGKQYPIKLADGYYIIRKLTVTECCRLQTMPDDYCRAVSKNQAYKGLGNGWTAEVIIHILGEALKHVHRDEEIAVLSMYDGIGTGRYVLDKLGFTNVRYYAYEIDKYAIQIAKSNYPDIIECGDAFQLRDENWTLDFNTRSLHGK